MSAEVTYRRIAGLNVGLWGQGETPVVVFHGGPGSGHSLRHLEYFDAAQHRVILFDQRGTGGSGRPGSIVANTTAHLLQDAETIREALGLQAWGVLGGSWGGALALAYAAAHPERVQGLVVRSALIACGGTAQWVLHDRAARCEAGRRARDLFLEPLDPQEQQAPVAAWFARIMEGRAPDDAARRVTALEQAFHGPTPGEVALGAEAGPAEVARAKVYLWYWLNGFFLPAEGPADPKAIAGMPHRLIHGADDLITPLGPIQAFAEAGGLSLEVLPRAGHDAFAAPMVAALRRALKDLL